MSKKYILVAAFLLALLLVGGNIVMAAEDSHSQHSSQATGGVAQENHSDQQNHNFGQNTLSSEQGHDSGSHESNTGASASHDGQSQDSHTDSNSGGHDSKPVKEVNIKPWVNTFLAYITGVLILALILKKGKGSNNNELAR